MRQVGAQPHSPTPASRLWRRTCHLSLLTLPSPCVPATACALELAWWVQAATWCSLRWRRCGGGKKLDQDLERGVQGLGFLVLMTAGVSLIIKDTLTLTGMQ